MVDFYPVETEDGTLSLYNTKYNDIYHSKIGAFTEALNKFTLPSGILEYAKNADYIRILDVCYGLGYNSRVAVNEIRKINPECKVHVTGIEIDPYVLACSYITNFDSENIVCKKAFRHALLSNTKVRRVLAELLNNVTFCSKYEHKFRPYYKQFKNLKHTYYKSMENNAILHNIYYRSVSYRNKTASKISYIDDFIELDIYIDDVRKILMRLQEQYDFIFLDPFTPTIAPCLWTVNIFKELYRLLDNNGNMTTYTSSAAVRSGMIESGFTIGNINPVGRKSSGTIACKKQELITNSLSFKEKGLLESTAGIPYYDDNFACSNEQIMKLRDEQVKLSDRITTSQYLKSFK